mgnify:CR=1 FL=1
MSSISRRRAVRILRDAGYHQVPGSKHDVWTNGEHTITLPRDTHGDLWGFMAQQIHRIEAGAEPPKSRRKR